MHIIIAKNQKELVDHFWVRGQVFIIGQDIDWEIEFDGLDDECVLFNAYIENQIAGVARLHHNKVERVATILPHRNKGVATALMAHIEDYAREMGMKELVLNAQIYVRDFYLNLGYVEEGDIFQEAYIDHVRMTKKL